MGDVSRLSAGAMAEAIRRREISALEIADAHLQRIEKLNPQLNAFVHLDPDATRRDARAADWAVKQHAGLGPLNGVPISIKSSIDVAGFRCEAGTKLRAGYVASHDAPLVSRLRRAGAVILGVTNSPELLMAWETDNLLYGRTNNPWDLSRTAGGSSGGEAAAIASCCSAAGVGSDGGGSIRVPAHFSGICGLKPTPGRIPATGHFPNSVGPFALLGVVGPMARTVADLRALFEVMQGYDEGDTCASPVPLRQVGLNEIKKIRIGYFEEDGRTPVTPETGAAVRSAALGLQRAGCNVGPFLPAGFEAAREVWWKLFGVAGAMLLGQMTAGREQDLSPMLKQFMQWTAAEPQHTAESLLNAWIQRDVLRMQVFAQLKEVPVLICPVAAIPAFRHGERSWMIGEKKVEYLDAWSYCEWFNLLGMPAAVVPVGPSKEGLPIGVQIVGQPWQEELVLEIAALVEQECGGWREPPIG